MNNLGNDASEILILTEEVSKSFLGIKIMTPEIYEGDHEEGTFIVESLGF